MLSDTPYKLRTQQANFTQPRKFSTSVQAEDGSNTRSATSADVKVGQKIKKVRLTAGHTQKHLADLVGVTGAQFHRYETGATRIAASRLMKIAAALGVRPEVLVDGISELAAPPPPPPPPLAVDANDLVSLVEVFSLITDPRRRKALISFARNLAENEAADGAASGDTR
ncbi:MAG: Transcriptional regulator, family [Rubritepida sp.]|nr:Transcriptional regulator, family [Rubritepida sp.]